MRYWILKVCVVQPATNFKPMNVDLQNLTGFGAESKPNLDMLACINKTTADSPRKLAQQYLNEQERINKVSGKLFSRIRQLISHNKAA